MVDGSRVGEGGAWRERVVKVVEGWLFLARARGALGEQRVETADARE